MYHKITDVIPAQITFSNEGELCITFNDATYVRAEKIIFDRKDSSLYAILHETSHPIGRWQGNADQLKDKVTLAAPHYFSGTLNIKTQLVVTG